MVAELQAFSGDAAFTTLTEPVDDAATTIYVASTDGWPGSGTGFTVTLDQYPDGQQISADLQETVFVRSYVGTTVTLDSVKGRGYDNTTAQSHVASAPVVHTLDAMFVNDLSARAFAVAIKGDIAYVGATSGVEMTRLPIGTDYQVIGADPTGVPVYQDSSKSLMTTTGDLLVARGANAPERLGVGTDGQVLESVAGVPAWNDAIAPATTVTGPDGPGDPTAVGTALPYAREDHDHGGPPDSGWVNMTLLNSWVVGDGLTPQYRLIGNRVTLRGVATGGTAGDDIAVLPGGYWPTQNMSIAGGSSSGAVITGCLLISTSGHISAASGDVVTLEFDSVSFLTD
jgi:hypothetical protein